MEYEEGFFAKLNYKIDKWLDENVGTKLLEGDPSSQTAKRAFLFLIIILIFFSLRILFKIISKN